jgi:hypothetical protein
MSGSQGGYLQGSELSVSAGAGGHEDGPSTLTVRRAPRVDLMSVEHRWCPVASSISGQIVPLDDVLDRLASGLVDRLG